MARALGAQGTTLTARLRGGRWGFAVGSGRLVAVLAVVLVAVLALGFAFAGSENSLAAGTKIAGVSVGGLTPKAAQQLLQRRSKELADVPVSFTAGGRSFSLRPAELGVTTNWPAAVQSASAKGDGFPVIRGYRRLALRLFPPNIVPDVQAYDAGVQYEVGLLAAKIDRSARDARLVRHGVRFTIVQGQTGEVLDQAAAADTIVAALAKFSRSPVALPLTVDRPALTANDLVAQRALARTIVSAPLTMLVGTRSIVLLPAQLASLVQLPTEEAAQVTIGGTAANRYFAKLARTIGHPAADATFAVDGPQVSIVPAQSGTTLDVVHSAAAVLAAAERSTNRVAHLVVASVAPRRPTTQARAMGITGLVGTYETIYGGIPNRIHNVQLVAHLIDGTMIAPGATFSFNQATGERTAAKGFEEAPVIIDGEVQTGLGGGVCQVSTTVFNAAFDAGLPITARTNHALYISHYPLGRDATVDYPDVDLKFVNDTSHWMLVRTFVGAYSLVVSLYGAPQHRRIVTDTAPLTVTAPAPVKRTIDRSLQPGQVVVESDGAPATSTSVNRLVYAPDGKLLYDNTWYSNYVAQPKIVLVGPKAKKPAKPAPETTTTTTTTTTAAATESVH
jgi:vancomycin resistance protein YoaR